jgi:ferredoxin
MSQNYWKMLRRHSNPLTCKEQRIQAEQGLKYTIQVAPEDCTGCGVCVEVCPAKQKSDKSKKALVMEPQIALSETRRPRTGISSSIFLRWTETKLHLNSIRTQQLQEAVVRVFRCLFRMR